ncbi:MAG: Cell shape-determining protein MreC [candidate division TM6 bacterium GW2011_GWE2_41_16]|nr:MAG: Cell shape-determining protein MreC [candidate division TM6 bacterium GW2011_GWE2_41_16]
MNNQENFEGKRIVAGLLLILVCTISTHERTKTYCQHFYQVCTIPVSFFEDTCVHPLQTRLASLLTWREAQGILDQHKDAYHDLLERYVDQQKTIAELKSQITDKDFISTYPAQKLIHTHIIKKNISTKEHTLVLDAGSEDAVTETMCAVYKNCIIGRIISLEPHTSTILLTTDPRSKIAAYTAKTNAQGIYQGSGLLDSARLMFVSHLVPIESDDLVLSRGDGYIFPPGFCLGMITRLENKDNLYHRIIVKPTIDVSHISDCYLIQKSAEHITISDRPITDRPNIDRPITEKPGADKNDIAVANKPTAIDRIVADKTTNKTTSVDTASIKKQPPAQSGETKISDQKVKNETIANQKPADIASEKSKPVDDRNIINRLFSRSTKATPAEKATDALTAHNPEQTSMPTT